EAVVVARQSSFGEKPCKIFMNCANVEGHVEGGITMHWGDKEGPSFTAYTEIEIKDKGTSIGGSYERHDDGTSDLSIYGKSDFEVEFDD
ncbi:MAG TPA: hypothetical protein VLG44_03525, partial [Chlamydiales bacterium]|nr:hypothetical protein [Chlamydiales bacterium]